MKTWDSIDATKLETSIQSFDQAIDNHNGHNYSSGYNYEWKFKNPQMQQN